MYQKNDRGFSLIELLIVVVIVGIVAAIAIPNLIAASKQNAVTHVLKGMAAGAPCESRDMERYRIEAKLVSHGTGDTCEAVATPTEEFAKDHYHYLLSGGMLYGTYGKAATASAESRIKYKKE